MQQHAGSVDQCGIGRFAGSPQGVEDIAFEGLTGIAGRLPGGDSPAEPVDGGATGRGNRCVAVAIRGGAEGRKIEQGMNRGDVSISVVHRGYSNPTGRARWS